MKQNKKTKVTEMRRADHQSMNGTNNGVVGDATIVPVKKNVTNSVSIMVLKYIKLLYSITCRIVIARNYSARIPGIVRRKSS